MPFALTRYTGDGVTTSFAIPFPFVSSSHVRVFLGSVAQSSGFTVSGTFVVFSTAPSTGVEVKILRNTSRSSRLTNYQDASTLTAATLNQDSIQAFYLAQEAMDWAEDNYLTATNGRYLGPKSADPTLANDGTALLTGDLYYNTSTNTMRVRTTIATWADLSTPGGGGFVAKVGDTMTGPLVLPANANASLQAVPLQQMENTVLGWKNRLANPNGRVNQRNYVSGTATTVANQVTVDRWRVVVAGQSLSWTETNGIRTFTAPAGGIEQVIQFEDIPTGTHVINWTGTATATINGTAIAKGGTFVSDGNSTYTLRFSSGTYSLPQIEPGTRPTIFEHRPSAIELLICQRDYEKSYDIGTAPGTNTGGGGSIEDFGGTVANAFMVGRVRFAVSKRSVPTVLVYDAVGQLSAVTTFTPGQNNAQAPSAVDNNGTSGFKVFMSQANISRLQFHWTAATGI